MTANHGGIESFLMNVFRSTDPAAVKFDFLTNEKRIAYQEEILARGSHVYHIPMRSKDPLSYFSALPRFFAKIGPYYDACWENVCSLGNVDYLAQAKRIGIPTRVIHCHNSQNMEGALRGALHKVNRKRITHLATDYWSCADSASRWFYGPDLTASPRYHVINNAIDVARFAPNADLRAATRAQLGIANHTTVIGNVGRFQKQKNHPFLLRMFQQYHRQNPDSALLLLGDGATMPDMKKLAQTLGIADAARFLGERDDALPFYQAMDLFLFPSLVEGMSVALLEAQAAGLPCLISTGNPEAAVINGNVERLGLDLPAEAWASAATQLAGRRLAESDNRLPGSVYDIRTQAHVVQDFFAGNHTALKESY